MNFIILIILAFATWRFADILVEEDGPWDIVLNFRNTIAMYYDQDVDAYSPKDDMIGQLFSCVRCMSVWVGAFWLLAWFILPTTLFYIIALPFAFSGMAILIDTMVYKG